MFIVTATSRIFRGIGSFFATIGTYGIYIISWDFGLFLLNLLSFKRKAGMVIQEGKPGYRGMWPEYIAPGKTDSRSPCPALNAMANHGIIARDGRNISYKELNKAIRNTYNLAPSFCYLLPKFAADLLTRDYDKDTIDLGDICVHNGIEHDASLTRHDTLYQPDQSKPDLERTEEFLAIASGKHQTFTTSDLAKICDKRRRESRAQNGMYTLGLIHKLFASANNALLLTTFGGRVDDLSVILKEERLPEGWEPRVRNPFGLTLASLNRYTFLIEFGITTSH